MSNLFDIVIPVGPNDAKIVQKQIEYTKRNVIGYRNIYLISYDPLLQVDGCITVDERSFPFTMDTVAAHLGKTERNGWYLQQLLKLYAGICIPDILGRYLVIDTDTFFLKQTHFVDPASNKCVYTVGREYHIPYFEHMTRLCPELRKKIRESGISNHMIFETQYVKQMMEMVEAFQGKERGPFSDIFLREVDKAHILGSGASEYEMYFNYMLNTHPDKILLRELKWCFHKNLRVPDNFDFVSVHWYQRDSDV